MSAASPELDTSARALPHISQAVDEFLDAYDQHRDLIADPDAGAISVYPRRFVLGALARLERRINPARRPFDPKAKKYPTGWSRLSTGGLPSKVVTALLIVLQYVATIIERWDVPEICSDVFPVEQVRGGKPFTLTPLEVKRLKFARDWLGGKGFFLRVKPAEVRKEWEKICAATTRVAPPPPHITDNKDVRVAPEQLVAEGFKPKTVREMNEEYGVSIGTHKEVGRRAVSAGKIAGFRLGTDGKLWIRELVGHSGSQDKKPSHC
jgi:hypothetical protein